MFNAVRSRKRGRRALADGADAATAKPLRDVVACLTGFPSEEKERIHLLIQELGGRYVNSCTTNIEIKMKNSAPKAELWRRYFSRTNELRLSPFVMSDTLAT
jgi:hypothetical protein